MKGKRRGSYDSSSNSDSDEDSDSAFSSENKENKKSPGKSQRKNKPCIMSTSSEEFSSDDSTKPAVPLSKTSPKKGNEMPQRRKSLVSNSSSNSSNSSGDSSDSDIPVNKPAAINTSVKRRPKILHSDSDSPDSDRETTTNTKLVKKPIVSPKDNSAKEVKKVKKPIGKNKIESSSSDSSSESESDSDDDRNKRKGRTVL